MAQYKTLSTLSTIKDENIPFGVPRIINLQERKTIIQNNKVVVIDYYSDWCGPCKHCAPQFALLAQQYTRHGMCVFVKENIEDNYGELPAEIQAVPCFHFYVNGEFQDEMTVLGADMDQIDKNIRTLLA